MLLLLLACEPAKVELDAPVDDTAQIDTDSGETGDSGESADTGDSVETGDSGDSGDTSETGETADTAPDAPPISGVTAWLDPEVVTLIHVEWTQDAAVEATWLEFSYEGGDVATSPPRSGEAGVHHELVIGVPSETDVSWRIVNQVDGAALPEPSWRTTATGTLPVALGDEPTVVTWDPSLASTERFMLGSIDVSDNWYYGPFWAFIVNREGRYVWYHEVPDNKLALYVQPAESGDHLFLDGSTQYVFEGGVYPTVTRMTLDGAYFTETVIDGYGFAIEEHGDGSVLYEHRDGGEFTLHALRPDGTDEELWSCNDYMLSIGADRRTQCNPNTIVWDRDRNTVFWSMYFIDTVLEVDLTTGETLKHFGQLDGGWAFDPAESVVDYQHYVNWSPEGTIMASTHVVSERGVQVCNEYGVDPKTETLTVLWQYESPDYYAQYAGECFRLPNRNTLVGYGVDGAVVEVTYDQQVVWELAWSRSPNSHLVGHMTLSDDLYAWNEGP